jgi:uncharacterized repeat protein (TIGR03803 family)
LLAACGGSQLPIGVPGALPQTSSFAARTHRVNYKVVYSFEGTPDGDFPGAGSLIDVKGTLYGTTSRGGITNASLCEGTCGTVFSITTGGREKVLHSFGQGNDGIYPLAGRVISGTASSSCFQIAS